MTLFIRNISPKASPEELKLLFRQFGYVTHIDISHSAGSITHSGFITMSTHAEADSLRDKLDGKDCYGYSLEIVKAREVCVSEAFAHMLTGWRRDSVTLAKTP